MWSGRPGTTGSSRSCQSSRRSSCASAPTSKGVDLHAHSDHVDSFYVLEGEAEFTFGGDVFRAGPGSYVAAPVGVPHGFRNAGDGELRLLNVHAPNVGFAQRLRRA